MDPIEKLKRNLQNRKEELESRIKSINADISHQNQPLSNDWSEQAVERENDEVLEALGNASQKEIAQINLALKRIESGHYQTCENCAEPIPIKRLELIPHTIYCTRCAEEIESSGNAH
ncbi:TraR/DksA family transcriptional regulator [Aliikangiella coralliicola]|uniref:TraR/DksA family transcriptional regulator n=1 Tax=Aliikangiella coralliicola TaxID=2592383 RepID=A0A545UFE1_9GAMM|nr:TraR/DksA C4-type zinc finger protein [Aliikangiella coralliicola]TQV88190.1 TraR/DksA family transcriptional regulator [Aliikangiella coralliicola]